MKALGSSVIKWAASLFLGITMFSSEGSSQEFSKNLAYREAITTTDYLQKLRALRVLTKQQQDSALAVQALEDLWKLETPMDSRAALQTYQRWLETQGVQKEDFTSKHISQITQFHQGARQPQMARQFLQWQLANNRTLQASKGHRDSVLVSLAEVYASQGDYQGVQALGVGLPYISDAAFREITLILDKNKTPYPPLRSGSGGMGDMIAFSRNSKTPVYLYVNPDLERLTVPAEDETPEEKKRREGHRDSDYFKAVALKDAAYFQRIVEDSSAALSYVSGGNFGLELKGISFEPVRTLRGKREYAIDLATAPDIVSKAGKAFVFLLDYPSGGDHYAGRGLIFVSGLDPDPQNQVSSFRLSMVYAHETLHSLGMAHLPLNLMKSGHLFSDEEGGKNIETLTIGKGEWYLGISAPLRQNIGWPQVPWLRLNPRRTIQENIRLSRNNPNPGKSSGSEENSSQNAGAEELLVVEGKIVLERLAAGIKDDLNRKFGSPGAPIIKAAYVFGSSLYLSDESNRLAVQAFENPKLIKDVDLLLYPADQKGVPVRLDVLRRHIAEFIGSSLEPYGIQAKHQRIDANVEWLGWGESLTTWSEILDEQYVDPEEVDEGRLLSEPWTSFTRSSNPSALEMCKIYIKTEQLFGSLELYRRYRDRLVGARNPESEARKILREAFHEGRQGALSKLWDDPRVQAVIRKRFRAKLLGLGPPAAGAEENAVLPDLLNALGHPASSAGPDEDSETPITAEDLWQLNAQIRDWEIELAGRSTERMLRRGGKDLLAWLKLPLGTSPRGHLAMVSLMEPAAVEAMDWSDPVARAAFVHWFIPTEQVFADGNHRTGLALMNILLRREELPVMPYKPRGDRSYAQAVAWNNGDPRPFVRFVKSALSSAGAEEAEIVAVTREFAEENQERLAQVDAGDPQWEREGIWELNRFSNDVRPWTGSPLKRLWSLSFASLVDGQPVAYVYATDGHADFPVAKNYPGLFIYRISTSKDHRRQGHGYRLLHASVSKAKELGIGPHVTLLTRDDNSNAHGFYESIGFKKKGTWADPRKGGTFIEYVADQEDLLNVLQRKVSPPAAGMEEGGKVPPKLDSFSLLHAAEQAIRQKNARAANAQLLLILQGLPLPERKVLEHSIRDAVPYGSWYEPLLMGIAFRILAVDLEPEEGITPESSRLHLRQLRRLERLVSLRNAVFLGGPALSVEQLFSGSLSGFQGDPDSEMNEKMLDVYVKLGRRLRFLPGEYGVRAIAFELFCAGNHAKGALDGVDMEATAPLAVYAIERLKQPLRPYLSDALKLGLLKFLHATERLIVEDRWIKRRPRLRASAALTSDLEGLRSMSEILELKQAVEESRALIVSWTLEFEKKDQNRTRFWLVLWWEQYCHYYRDAWPNQSTQSKPFSLSDLLFDMYGEGNGPLIDQLPISSSSEDINSTADPNGPAWGIYKKKKTRAALADLRRADSFFKEFREEILSSGAEESAAFRKKMAESMSSAIRLGFDASVTPLSGLDDAVSYMQDLGSNQLMRKTQPLRAIDLPGKGEASLIKVQTLEAVTIPVSPGRSIALISADYEHCVICVARGLDANGKPVYAEWHYKPPTQDRPDGLVLFNPDPLRSLLDQLPEWLRGMRDVRLLVVPPAEFMGEMDPEAVRTKLAEAGIGAQSVAIIPRKRGSLATSLVTEDGVAILMHPCTAKQIAPRYLRAKLLRGDVKNFYAWSWDGLNKTGVMAQIASSWSLSRNQLFYDPLDAGAEEGSGVFDLSIRSIGEFLRLQRLERELKQKFVAARTGISQPALSRIEQDRAPLDLARAMRLGTVLGFDGRKFYEEVVRHATDPSVQKRLSAFIKKQTSRPRQETLDFKLMINSLRLLDALLRHSQRGSAAYLGLSEAISEIASQARDRVADYESSGEAWISRDIGAYIRRKRQEKGWTLAEFGKKVGLSQPTMTRIELGISSLDEDQVIQIGLVLGFDGKEFYSKKMELNNLAQIREALSEFDPRPEQGTLGSAVPDGVLLRIAMKALAELGSVGNPPSKKLLVSVHRGLKGRLQESDRAGAEEGLAWEVRRHLREGNPEIGGFGLSKLFAVGKQKGFEWQVDFETEFFGDRRLPVSHLVKGAGNDVWLHLHLMSRKGNVIKNGFLFRIIQDESGKWDLTDPLVERDGLRHYHDNNKEFAALGLMPGEPDLPLLDEADLEMLMRKAREALRRHQEELLPAIQQAREGSRKLNLVLARSVTPGGPSLWLMRWRSQFPKGRRHFMHPRGIVFERQDMGGPLTPPDRKYLDYLASQKAAVLRGFLSRDPFPFFRVLLQEHFPETSFEVMPQPEASLIQVRIKSNASEDKNLLTFSFPRQGMDRMGTISLQLDGVQSTPERIYDQPLTNFRLERIVRRFSKEIQEHLAASPSSPAAGMEERGVVRVNVRMHFPEAEFDQDDLERLERWANVDIGARMAASGGSGAVFHETDEHYYILSSSHVVNPLTIPYQGDGKPEVSFELTLSNGMQIPAKLLGSAFGPSWNPPVAFLRIRKEGIPPGAISVIPLAPPHLVREAAQSKASVQVAGYPGDAERQQIFRILPGKVVAMDEEEELGFDPGISWEVRKPAGEDGWEPWRVYQEHLAVTGQGFRGGISGGPMVYQGRIVGINEMSNMDRTSLRAVTADSVRGVMKTVIEGRLSSSFYEANLDPEATAVFSEVITKTGGVAPQDAVQMVAEFVGHPVIQNLMVDLGETRVHLAGVLDLTGYFSERLDRDSLKRLGFKAGVAQLVPRLAYLLAKLPGNSLTIYIEESSPWAQQVEEQLRQSGGFIRLVKGNEARTADVVIAGKDIRFEPGRQILVHVQSAETANSIVPQLFAYLEYQNLLAAKGGIIFLYRNEFNDDLLIAA